MEIGFQKRDVNESLREYKEKFQDVLWVVELTDVVRKLKVKGINITDILIKQNGIFLGILKSFYPIDFFEDMEDLGNLSRVTSDYRIQRHEIERFVYKFPNAEKILSKNTADFSLSVYGLGTYRINLSKKEDGLIMNMRVLDFNIPNFDYVFYPLFYRQKLDELIYRATYTFGNGIPLKHNILHQGGLIIHAGMTGSGKTTCVAAELNYFLENSTGLILSYEEPIEYRFLNRGKILQYEIGVDIEKEEIRMHALRNNPNIIFYGEIRDKRDFLDVIDLSNRGHLVITTMHASNVLEVIKFATLFDDDIFINFINLLRHVVCHKLIMAKNGTFVPLYEILSPNTLIRSLISDVKLGNSKMTNLENYLYKDNAHRLLQDNIFYKFSDSLSSYRNTIFKDYSPIEFDAILKNLGINR